VTVTGILMIFLRTNRSYFTPFKRMFKFPAVFRSRLGHCMTQAFAYYMPKQ